jgi:hypothetical protein
MKTEHNTKGMSVNERAAYWVEFFKKQDGKQKPTQDEQGVQVLKRSTPRDNRTKED